jgi:hypothetical protein
MTLECKCGLGNLRISARITDEECQFMKIGLVTRSLVMLGALTVGISGCVKTGDVEVDLSGAGPHGISAGACVELGSLGSLREDRGIPSSIRVVVGGVKQDVSGSEISYQVSGRTEIDGGSQVYEWVCTTTVTDDGTLAARITSFKSVN